MKGDSDHPREVHLSGLQDHHPAARAIPSHCSRTHRAELLAMILEAKFGQHLPLNRQSETYAREDIHLDVSTMADWVGACTAVLAPLVALIRAHVLGAARIHGDNTPCQCWPAVKP